VAGARVPHRGRMRSRRGSGAAWSTTGTSTSMDGTPMELHIVLGVCSRRTRRGVGGGQGTDVPHMHCRP
jgi:hypothetical protein